MPSPLTQRATRSTITGGSVPGASGVSLLARLRGNAGTLITQASLTSIAYTVSDLTSGSTLGTGTFSVSGCVFDSLQQGDPRWFADSAGSPGHDGSHGYNFLGVVPASLVSSRTIDELDLLVGQQPEPHEIQADIVFTPVTGQAWRVVFRWRERVVYA